MSVFFFSSRRRHTRFDCDWSSDVCSSDLLEFIAEAGPGDFIYVPPFVPHQEINASDDEPLSCVLVRSGQEPVVVNLDLPNVESNPESVHWVDNIHPEPKR